MFGAPSPSLSPFGGTETSVGPQAARCLHLEEHVVGAEKVTLVAYRDEYEPDARQKSA
jgi:hypothetical protein